jgi:hypothetical protein
VDLVASVGIVFAAKQDLDASAVVIDDDDAVAVRVTKVEADADAGEPGLVDLGRDASVAQSRGRGQAPGSAGLASAGRPSPAPSVGRRRRRLVVDSSSSRRQRLHGAFDETARSPGIGRRERDLEAAQFGGDAEPRLTEAELGTGTTQPRSGPPGC